MRISFAAVPIMIPPAWMLPRKQADEALVLPLEPTSEDHACAICGRRYVRLYMSNGNGPYCHEHRPTVLLLG